MLTFAATYTKVKTQKWYVPFYCQAEAQGTFTYETGVTVPGTGVRIAKKILEVCPSGTKFYMEDGATVTDTYAFAFYYRLKKTVYGETVGYSEPMFSIESSGAY